jgi:signal transduction histidine kinase/CheY-like chemotaxis protein
VAVFVLLSVVPLGLLGGITLHLASQALDREADSRMRSTASLSAAVLREELGGLADLVESYAQRPALLADVADPTHLRRRVIRDHLSALRQARPGIATTFLARPDGRLVDIVPSTPSIIGNDFSYRDWYTGVTRTGGPYVSRAYTSLAAGHPNVVAAAAILRAPSGAPNAGRPLGIIVAAYSLDQIQHFVDRFARSQGVSLTVTDQRGVLVAAPGPVRSGLHSRRDDPLVSAALAGHTGSIRVDRPSGEVLAGYTPIRSLGWTVTASVPERMALGPVGKLRSRVLEVGAVLAVALLAALLLVVRNLRGRQRAEQAAERNAIEAERSHQEAVAARREADRANAAKSEFLSRMSHELRTPLNAVLGFAQLLEMDGITPEQRESVGQIMKGGSHLLQLIDEVLDIARIETGHMPLSVEPVEVGSVVAESIALVRPLAAQQEVSLVWDPEPSAGLHAGADRQRLKQVLLNLLSNAVKYGGGGGRVVIDCRRAPEGRISLAVSDVGPGIPQEKLSQLFVPFERLGADLTPVEGTGLGLALSKRLVEAMGGAIHVETQVGLGSTFFVELPLVEAPVESYERSGEDEVSAPSPGVERTVLYVEDNQSNLKLVERILAKRPEISLIQAMQGGLGLELARVHDPDLILLDLNLPDISGQEFLARLRRTPWGAHIPVVVVTADAMPGRLEALKKAGAMTHLTKPFDVRRFLEVVQGERVDR